MLEGEDPSPEGGGGGFRVGDIEGKLRKHGLKIVICASFVLSAFSVLLWGSQMLLWSILLCMGLAVVGQLLSKSLDKITTSAMKFVNKDKITLIVVAAALIVISIFLPVIIFSITGLMGGKGLTLVDPDT